MSGSDLILKYFPDLSSEQIHELVTYSTLQRQWNLKINLISRKDIDHLSERHILPSLSIKKAINIPPGSSMLDVGTGGGFPGIPLAILHPEVTFHLIDSVGKKVRAVKSITNSLELKNVSVQQIRAEELHEKYDFVTGRAVKDLRTFSNWVKGNLKRNKEQQCTGGILYLKGGNAKSDEKIPGFKSKIYPLSQFFEEPFFEFKYLVHLS